MAATLVVGTFAVTTTTIATTGQSAFAYSQKKKGGGEESRNGNTITIQKYKQAVSQSGFDNNQGQECENLICTHPRENATCTQEGAVAVTPIPTPKTCEECITTILTPQQITALVHALKDTEPCELSNRISEDSLADQLVQCLLNAGVHITNPP
jgi:hypothetical protein